MAEFVVMYAQRANTVLGAYARGDIVSWYPNGTLATPPSPLSPSQPFCFVKVPDITAAEVTQFMAENSTTDADGTTHLVMRRTWFVDFTKLPVAAQTALTGTLVCTVTRLEARKALTNKITGQTAG